MNWNFKSMVLTDVEDRDRKVEVQYRVDPGQAEQRPIFDKKTGDLVDPGDPYEPPMIDDIKIYEGDVEVTNQFEYDFDRLLL